MAEFSTEEKVNLSLKMVFGIQGLSNTSTADGLKWYEENYSWQPFIVNDEIFAEVVPLADNKTAADAAVSSFPAILEKRDIKLSPVAGTNGRAWAAYQTYGDSSSGFFGDWILPFYWGRGYAMQLFKDNGAGARGVEITTTEGAWIPSYKFGFIVLANGYSASSMGWTTPLWASVYRYIGAKGISGATANVSLNDAYNKGDTITVDAGPVTLNASTNYAPLQLTPISYTPSAGLAAGQVCINDGVLYAYDGTRSKWLSVDQPIASFQIRSGDGNYLATGTASDSKTGFNTIRKGTIVGVAAAGGSGNQTKEFEIRRNGTVSSLSSFSLTAGKYTDSTVNSDFDAGDVLQVYCSAVGTPAQNPRVDLIISWRI